MTDKYKVVEIFKSISGEGISAGEVKTFLRFEGCNLRCKYCDTTYSYDDNGSIAEMTLEEIMHQIQQLKCRELIITGGEPLEKDTKKRTVPLLLAKEGYDVRIETNGANPLYSKEELENFGLDENREKIHYVLDIKCPCSGMSKFDMFEENIGLMREHDEIKCVVGSMEDIDFAMHKIKQHEQIIAKNKVAINFSTVYGDFSPLDVVEFLKNESEYFESRDIKARLSLQIHKILWDKEERGV